MARSDSNNSIALFSLYLTIPSPNDVVPFACHGLYFSLEEAKVAFQLLAREVGCAQSAGVPVAI
ncbi:hypothetical protein ABG977_10055 [Collinsella aerofaciens]|jgi:hypothetical protein|nr:hypothetical protein [Collinsella sp.]